jgi:multiple sugar transport system substrate-binding protein
VKDRHFREIADAGYVSSLAEREGAPHQYSFLRDLFADGGVPYAQPFVFSPLVLAYNRRHFLEAGLTEPDAGWTWEDAVANAAKLSVPGQRYGLHFQVQLDERWPVFLLQSGDRGETGGADDRVGEAWLEGIRLCKTIIRNPAIFPDPLYGSDNDVGTLFLQERTSMIMTGYESLNRFASSGLDYDISSVPYIRVPRTLVSATGIAVNKRSKHRAEAECFADYLCSPRAQRLVREHTLSIPALKPAAEAIVDPEDETVNRPSRFQLYRDIIPSFRKFADLRLPSGAIRPLHETLKDYWTDLIDERTLCEKIEVIASAPSARHVHS